MKYIMTFLFLLTGLFAHGSSETHMHFLSTLHAQGFILFIVCLIAVGTIFRHFFKETN